MTDERTPRDAGNWAAKVDRLTVSDEVREYGFNVVGMRVAGPQQGFGKLWQRTFWTDLGDRVTPEALVADWKANFGDFWPKTGRFHGELTGIEPGAVAALEVGLPTGSGPTLSTGVLVLYADETSFSFLCPEGHQFAGMITFSAETVETGTRAKIQMMIRCSDPIFETAWPLAKKMEGEFWNGTLHNIAASRGIPDARVEEFTECLDHHRLWKNWTNLRHNSGIRSVWHLVTGPFRPQAA